MTAHSCEGPHISDAALFLAHATWVSGVDFRLLKSVSLKHKHFGGGMREPESPYDDDLHQG